MAIIEMLKATCARASTSRTGEKEGKSLLDAMRDGALDGMQYFDGELEKAGARRHDLDEHRAAL
jgi:twitching motility protein PilT